MEQPPSEIITQTETPSEEIAQVQVLFGMIRERDRQTKRQAERQREREIW